MRKAIVSDQGAPPKGIYSQALVAQGQQVYVSGQGPINPATGELQLGTFQEQAELVFHNVQTLLEAAGTNWANVVKTNIYLSDLNNFAEMNEIYKTFLSEPYPARTTIQAELGNKAIVVDCIAVIPE